MAFFTITFGTAPRLPKLNRFYPFSAVPLEIQGRVGQSPRLGISSLFLRETQKIRLVNYGGEWGRDIKAKPLTLPG